MHGSNRLLSLLKMVFRISNFKEFACTLGNYFMFFWNKFGDSWLICLLTSWLISLFVNLGRDYAQLIVRWIAMRLSATSKYNDVSKKRLGRLAKFCNFDRGVYLSESLKIFMGSIFMFCMRKPIAIPFLNSIFERSISNGGCTYLV